MKNKREGLTKSSCGLKGCKTNPGCNRVHMKITKSALALSNIIYSKQKFDDVNVIQSIKLN